MWSSNSSLTRNKATITIWWQMHGEIVLFKIKISPQRVQSALHAQCLTRVHLSKLMGDEMAELLHSIDCFRNSHHTSNIPMEYMFFITQDERLLHLWTSSDVCLSTNKSCLISGGGSTMRIIIGISIVIFLISLSSCLNRCSSPHTRWQTKLS